MINNNTSIALLKSHIDTHNETARKERIESLHESLDELFLYEDKLTLLVLENTLIDILHSKLTIKIATEDDLHPGWFSKFIRQIVINDSHYHENFSTVEDASTLLHEMTHAVSCFAFRTDPFAFKEFFEKQEYGSSIAAERAIDSAMKEFIEGPDLPYSANRPGDWKTFSPKAYSLRSTNRKTTFDNYSTLFSINLNPSKLKFNHCVREDAANTKDDKYLRFPEDKIFDHLAWNLQSCLSDPKNPEEIFSVYMECRLYLLRQAKERVISREEVFNLLEKIAPKVHAYFETDVIKLLSHRLIHYTEKFPSEFESQYLRKYPHQKNDNLQERYLSTGVLKFIKS